MPLDSITNKGEFFSNHYLAAVISSDLNDVRKTWEELESRGEPSPRSRLRSGRGDFFDKRATASEAGRTQQASTVRDLNDVALQLLGFTPDRKQTEFDRADGTDQLHLTTAASAETSTGLLAVAIDAGLAADVDQLLATTEPERDDLPGHPDTPHLLLTPGKVESDKRNHVNTAADAVSELFSVDDPPRYVLIAGGRIVLLAERSKWAEGRFLAVNLDAALERMDNSKGGEIDTIAALFSVEALTPDDGQSTLDELTDNSHKHAVGVSKELRNGIRLSIEILANATIQELDQQARDARQKQFSRSDVDARDLTKQCLRWVYRLLVLLYAESRSELGILPVDDDAYMAGYSLDRLRELCLVDLDTGRARSGSHLDESLKSLFELVNNGYHAEAASQQLFAVDGDGLESREDYLQFPGLDAQLFEPKYTELLDQITLPNHVLQQVLTLLMLTPEKKTRGKKNNERGFISYAQLGINQLGAVYEGLMAYTGFFADQDLYEVAKDGDPSDGTWMLPVADADEYPDDVFVTHTDEITGREERVLHPRGSFVFRLSGRDRQRSASYYTPEVLTRCVVKHALAELLGTDDYAPEHGSSGILPGEAHKILDLTICEPALGSGAFANEAINQLSAEYLKRAQAERGETLDPETYAQELQKVKAHFALHQTYGVDLNETAVELAEVSLWLNAMYPGLKAPWFGLQLRRGNSLIGCRRATWKSADLWRSKKGPWAETRKDHVKPPTDRKLHDPLEDDEIHYFLLPGHGWAAVADRKESKELRPDQAKGLKEWRKQMLAAPNKSDADRLRSLAAAVERTWDQAADRIAAIQRGLRRPIDLYGTDESSRPISTSRAQAEAALSDPDSPLGRLRTLMDAWIGLWFWPLDTGLTPPTWDQWLRVAEELLRPDAAPAPTGQLDLFDLDSLVEQQKLPIGQIIVADLRDRSPWLDTAIEAARREGAWHWDLEFAPVFNAGGFNFQVGNPPWVKPIWKDDLVLAENDPWWGVTDKPPAQVQKDRRSAGLINEPTQSAYLGELASAAGVVEILGSPNERPVLAGIQTNLYMVFMDTVWRHLAVSGTVGLLHPEGHFTDPKGGDLRRATYAHLRRHWQFVNELFLFEDIHHMNVFGIHVYGEPDGHRFAQSCNLFHPDVIERSLDHDGTGVAPGIQYPQGGWDLRPHRARVLEIDESVLTDWALLFDEPGTPAAEARLLRPVTTADLEALSALARQPVRLADHDYHWTRGHEEDRAKRDGIIRWETAVPDSWDEVILQGPHFTIATPFAKQPNENCKHNQDYSDWDLESLPAHVIPRTNYQRACDRETYDANLDHWNGLSSTQEWRVGWRLMTQPGLERSLHAALLPINSAHIHGVYSLTVDERTTVAVAGLMASIVADYMVKVSGTANITMAVAQQIPTPFGSPLDASLLLRTLRLNCLTADYAPLWEELYDSSWQQDRWTDPDLDRVALGDVGPGWTMDTPLRRDYERRLALVELDALAALMLGLTAEQLCAMYRTQFAVLRKYEYKMVFDSEGRKICGYHQSAGYRQSQLQEQAKAGDLPKDWSNLWKLYEQYEADPDSVDWMGLYTPPFTPADRESEMTRAYNDFTNRLQAGRAT